MDRRRFVAGGIASWAATPRLAAAQAGWMLLGSRSVNWSAGRDSIMVARRGPLGSLSFIPRGREIFITNVEISFTRGAPQRIPVNMRLRPDLRSSILRPRSGEIRRIEFWFRRPPPAERSRRTTLEVFGRR